MKGMNPTQENRDAEIITPLGKDALLLYNMHIQEELGRLFSIETELISKKDDINFEDLLGQNVTIRLNLIDGTPRYFNGYITRFSQLDRRDAFGGVYQATIQPWLWFLTRRSDCKIFQNETVPEIIIEMFAGYSVVNKLQREYRKWDYCVQYRETNFNFVSRLMEQEGIYYFFEHDNGAHKLILADDFSPHKEIFTINGQVPLFSSNEVAVRDEESCTNWHISKNVLPGTYTLNDYDFKRTEAELSVSSTIDQGHSMSGEEIYDYPGEYVKLDDGGRYSKNRIQELHSQYEVAQSSSNVHDMKAGGLFTLAEHSRKDQNKEYLIVSVNHSYQNDDYGAGGNNGGDTQYSNSITAIDSKTVFRSSQITPKPIVQGPQTAIVVGDPKEEIDTDKEGYGMVKVQFHWDRYGNSDQNSSCWIRVSQLWAGQKWGGMHIPRRGQEVIVDFLEGDPDHPIITGRVYNKANMPPFSLPQNKTQSGIRSRSSKGGSSKNFNEIRMEDKKGKEEFFIHAEKDMNSVIKDNETLTVKKGNRTLTVETGDESKSIKKGNMTEKISKTKSTTAEIIQTDAKKTQLHLATDEIKLKVGESSITLSKNSIVLKHQSSKIEMKSDGILIDGKVIHLNKPG